MRGYLPLGVGISEVDPSSSPNVIESLTFSTVRTTIPQVSQISSWIPNNWITKMATTIQKGDTVLVTGVNGYIGAHVAEELIAAGYKVRGTSRSKAKAEYLIDYFGKKFGDGKIEIQETPDMLAEGAYDEAVKGVAGIVHLASVLSFSNKPEEVIPPTVKGALNVLKSASTEPKLKSFVYCSSSAAAFTPVPDTRIKVTKDTWNDDAIQKARNDPNVNGFTVYNASKAEGERAVWAAVKQTNPPFQVAAVLPYCNFGTRLKAEGNSTGDWLMGLYNGDDMMFSVPPLWYINVSDDAKLHVAALVDPSCNGQRIFGFAGKFSGNDLLAEFRKLEPNKTFIEDRPQGQDLSEVQNEDAEALLKKHYGHGWTSLEETVKQNIGPVLA